MRDRRVVRRADDVRNMEAAFGGVCYMLGPPAADDNLGRRWRWDRRVALLLAMTNVSDAVDSAVGCY
ncbi:hypothetical protein [Anaerohalosphaera lusitana]|uniref:hypothetical protein n=1 Tax=Anaerohalosphaera lusitana TaxID=1936003 RepID=UPI0011BAAEE0|nr:hypothetical protein [Anaerohalosphaera lusitana]